MRDKDYVQFQVSDEGHDKGCLSLRDGAGMSLRNRGGWCLFNRQVYN